MDLIEYVGEADGGGAPAPACVRTANSSMLCIATGAFNLPPSYDGPTICVCQDSTNNTYSCLRAINASVNFRFCEFADAASTVEYFDYASDPYELVNLAPTMNAGLKATLHSRLAEAKACVGAKQCQAVLQAPL